MDEVLAKTAALLAVILETLVASSKAVQNERIANGVHMTINTTETKQNLGLFCENRA